MWSLVEATALWLSINKPFLVLNHWIITLIHIWWTRRNALPDHIFGLIYYLIAVVRLNHIGLTVCNCNFVPYCLFWKTVLSLQTNLLNSLNQWPLLRNLRELILDILKVWVLGTTLNEAWWRGNQFAFAIINNTNVNTICLCF